MKLSEHINEERFKLERGLSLFWAELRNGDIVIKDNAFPKMLGKIEKSLKSIAYKSKENAFDVLMSCMPKSAENINSITPEDARKMLQDFVKKYWQN